MASTNELTVENFRPSPSSRRPSQRLPTLCRPPARQAPPAFQRGSLPWRPPGSSGTKNSLVKAERPHRHIRRRRARARSRRRARAGRRRPWGPRSLRRWGRGPSLAYTKRWRLLRLLWSAARVQKGVLVGPPSAHVKAQSTASSLSSTGFNYYVTKDIIIIYQRGEDSVHSHCHTSMTSVTKRSPVSSLSDRKRWVCLS